MRIALVLAVVAALAACSSRSDRIDRTGDPAVGRWRGASGTTIELRADGSLDMDPTTSPSCDGDTALVRRCRARQRWTRSGSIVSLERAVVADQPASLGFAGKPCECRSERIQVELRGDELIYGTEHAARVR